MNRPFETEIAHLADRIVKGIIVHGFENDADCAHVVQSQQKLIEDAIHATFEELMRKVK